MKRLALLVPVAAAAAAVAAPSAGAGTFKGIVVERDAARHTIAVASPAGVVRTVRTTRLRAAGTRVSVSATKLPDLTFRASRVGVLGRARLARVHGVVLRHLSARTLVSAGGSVLSIRTTGSTFASANRLRPGTIVNARVRIEHGHLSAPRLIQAGQATVFEAEGTIASLSPLELTVEHGVTITLTVPAALTLPAALAVGDRVEAIVSFDGTTYTLVTLQREDRAGVGEDEDRQEVEVEGTVTTVAADSSSITVRPRNDGSPVTFAVPAGFDLHGVKQGDRVEAKGFVKDGVLTLAKLELKDGGDDEDDNGSGDDNGGGDGGGHHDGSGSGGSGGGGDDGGSGGGGDD